MKAFFKAVLDFIKDILFFIGKTGRFLVENYLNIGLLGLVFFVMFLLLKEVGSQNTAANTGA